MKIIGITGESGAGKTTFSDYLGKKEGIGVIHVDEVFKEIKLTYFRFLMKDNNEEHVKLKMDLKHKKILYTNPLLFRCFMKFRAKLVEKRLRKRIEELGRTNDTILIDDTFIKHHKIYQKLDELFLIERAEEERQTALLERDEIPEEELIIYKEANAKEKHGNFANKVVKTIQNNGDKKELEKTAEQIYEKELKKDTDKIKEKYKTNTPIRVPLEKQNSLDSSINLDEPKKGRER